MRIRAIRRLCNRKTLEFIKKSKIAKIYILGLFLGIVGASFSQNDIKDNKTKTKNFVEYNDDFTDSNRSLWEEGLSLDINNYGSNKQQFTSVYIAEKNTVYTRESYSYSGIAEEDSPNEEVGENTVDTASIDVNAAAVSDVTEEDISVDNVSEYASDVIDLSCFPCEEDLKWHIMERSASWEVPYEIAFTILSQESGGQWNANGVRSGTGDWGMSQTNENYLNYIANYIGHTVDEVKYDPYVGAEATVGWIDYYFNYYGYTMDNFNYRNIFGSYNGGPDWYDTPAAVQYADSCMQRLQNYFGTTDSNYFRENAPEILGEQGQSLKFTR